MGSITNFRRHVNYRMFPSNQNSIFAFNKRETSGYYKQEHTGMKQSVNASVFSLDNGSGKNAKTTAIYCGRLFISCEIFDYRFK